MYTGEGLGGLGLGAVNEYATKIERERVKAMQLQEIDTLQDLKIWVEENMSGAEVYEDMHGTLVIRTNLISTMGGYLHEREGEGDE
jgi:hypothetical protein